jgi:hypothetical protein
MKKYFTVYDNYIAQDVCREYITKFKENEHNVYTHADSNLTSSLPLSPDTLTDDLIKKFNIQYRISNLEVVKRVPGSNMANHFDRGDALAFVIYLNDTYEGGHTIFEDTISINPKVGRLLLFTNGTFQHRVSAVITGERYVLAGWFK